MCHTARLLPAISLIAFMTSGCSFAPRHWVEDEESLSIPIQTLQQVKCKTHNGKIDIIADGSAAEAVLVDIKLRAGGDDEADARHCLEAIEIIQEYDKGVLNLGWRWRDERRNNWQAGVSFFVRSPPDVFARAETHNGPVRLEGIHGGADVLTHNGSLHLVDCADDVVAQTHNGPIVATLDSPNVRLKTHNGSIEARLNTIASINGHIETHNGGILIALGPEASTRLDCSTHNGALQAGAGLRVVSRSKRSLVTEAGDGEGKLVASTHNGRIKVEQATALPAEEAFKSK